MNLRKKMRRGSLAALIALALTSSALAMPTGGVVQSGDVNIGGSTDFSTVANGATIGATTDSTINWNTFNIANGETLNFNIADGKLLLNQVTGAQASDILGTMNQTGKGSLALVNPNGIHIGQNAVLDVNSLTLSTLGIGTKNDAETLLRQGALGARAITVDQGAQFDIARKLNLFGGQVAVADGVVFNLNNVPDPRESMLEVVAAKELYWQEGADHDSDLSKWTMERGNTVDFHGTVNALSTGKDAEINIMGYAVNADRAHIDGDRAEVAIAAWTKLVSDDRNNAPVKTTKVELSPENVVRADGLQIREKKSTEIRGGKVELKNSTIDSARLDITAQKSFDSAGNMDVTRGHEALTATADNSVALDNVTINGITGPERYHWFEITGGAVNIANANIHTEKTLNVSAISSLDRTMKNRHWATPIELVGTRTTTAANTLNVTNSTLRVTRPAWESPTSGAVQADLNAKDVKLTGGTVHLTGATIETPLIAQIMAGTTTEGEDTPYDQTAHTPSTTELHSLQSTPAHTVTIDGTSMIRSTDVAVGGGKVTVGNDVTFHLGDGSGGAMELVAGSRVLSGEDEITTSAAGNEVQFHGKIRGVGMKNQDVDIEGHVVNLDHADIRDVGEVYGVAMNRHTYTENEHGVEHSIATIGAGNTLSADGMTVEAKEINLMGGQMTLKNATITAEKGALQAGTIELADDKTKMSRGGVIYLDNTKVTMNHTPDAFVAVGGTMNLVNGSEVKTPVGSAVFMLGQSYNGYEDKLNVTKDNKLSLWNSKIEAHDLIDISAGGIGVWQGSEVNAGNELRVDMASADTIRTDGSTGTLLRDAASHVTEAGAEVAEFAVQEAEPVPQPPTLPTETPLSEQDQENIETGKLKAQDALVEPTQEKRAEALAKTVAQLNEKVGTSRRQTAGIVVGIVQEIANASTLSDGEKVALVERVLSAYAPVQEVKAEQDNTATNTHDEAVNAAANVSVAPVYPDETEAEDAITFA